MNRRWYLLALLTLTGCSGGFFETKLPVPTTYVLAPATQAGNSAPLANVDLAIGMPSPAPGLDTERVAALYDSRRLDYYRDVQWGATAAGVVQSVLTASMQNQQLFRSVTTEQARISATHLLDLQLRDFQAEYTGGGTVPTIRVTVVASLIRLKDRKLLASIPATAAVAAAENRMSSVIAAFESAAQQVALSIGTQTATVIAASP